MNASTNKGITLIELLLVIAIIGILSSVIVASFGSFRSRQALSNTANTVVAYVNEARSQTLAGVNNTNYSVRFETNRLVLFVGASYNSSASTNVYASFDTPVTLSAAALHGGGNTLTFDRLTGTTSDYGTLSFTNGAQNQTITINASGTITQ